MQLRRPVLVFFGFTFLLSGAAVAPLVASAHALLPIGVPPFLGFLAAFGPGVAAVLTTLVEEGSAGVRRLLRSVVRRRVRVGWYVGSLLFAPVMLTLTFGVNAWLGAPFPSVVPRLPDVLPLFVFFTLQTGLGEELGWRGFAQRRLQCTIAPTRAALVVGMVWSLWHLPLFVLPGSMQWQLTTVVGTPAAVGGYSVYVVLTAVLYAVMMNASGSLLVPMLLHGSTNAAGWLFSLNEVAQQGVRPMVLLVILQGAFVFAWWLGARGSGGFRPPNAAPPDSLRRFSVLTRVCSAEVDHQRWVVST